MSNNNMMDISPDNIKGECELKCNYYFNYSNSNCIVENMGILLKLNYDKSVSPPVVYNENKYIVDRILLVSPSVHLFNKNQTNAELLIVHTPVTTGNALIVCVPVKAFDSFKNPNSLLDSIISRAGAGVPRQGMTANIPITNFNLTSLVPKDAFFSYSDNLEGGRDFIVFGITSAIPIGTDNAERLSKIIQPLPTSIFPGGQPLFYNKKGPAASMGISNNDIYIDCQPTDSSEEEVMVSPNSGSTVPQIQYDLGDATGFTSFLQIFLLAIIILAILFGCYHFISKINTKYTGSSSSTAHTNKATITKKTFTFTSKEGFSTAIYLIAYIMWAALLAVLYFFSIK